MSLVARDPRAVLRAGLPAFRLTLTLTLTLVPATLSIEVADTRGDDTRGDRVPRIHDAGRGARAGRSPADRWGVGA